MRFAWLKKKSADYVPAKQSFIHPLAVLRFVYNAAFWVFLVPFFSSVSYGFGFIAFAIVILLRFVANLLTNNVLNFTPEQYERYPFRIP